jgi:hypothetical protein
VVLGAGAGKGGWWGAMLVVRLCAALWVVNHSTSSNGGLPACLLHMSRPIKHEHLPRCRCQLLGGGWAPARADYDGGRGPKGAAGKKADGLGPAGFPTRHIPSS